MVIKASHHSLKLASSILQKGGLVAFPTETVYGLGADALNPQAVAKIFVTKGRPTFNPLIVHIADRQSLGALTHDIDPQCEVLMKAFWPGPLTIVLPASEAVPKIVTAGLSTVAVRMPSHPVALELIHMAGTPIAAPSANLSGGLSPTQAMHVWQQLGENIGLILDGGECSIGLESTVVTVVDGTPVLLRHGGLPLEDIEKVVGKVFVSVSPSTIQSPGQMLSHYAPRTPLVIVDSVSDIPEEENIGVLLFQKPDRQMTATAIEILSEEGNMTEAAISFFSALHRLDDSGVKKIYAERVPETGLGAAIMDRLNRASFTQ